MKTHIHLCSIAVKLSFESFVFLPTYDLLKCSWAGIICMLAFITLAIYQPCFFQALPSSVKKMFQWQWGWKIDTWITIELFFKTEETLRLHYFHWIPLFGFKVRHKNCHDLDWIGRDFMALLSGLLASREDWEILISHLQHLHTFHEFLLRLVIILLLLAALVTYYQANVIFMQMIFFAGCTASALPFLQ